LVILLGLAVFVTLVRNRNSWEGGKAEQVTDDAYVRGDLTPLSTKVTGIVSAVHVADYQQLKKGDLLLELQDSDYQAEVAQANAGVAAPKAAIENNRRQKQLQQAKIDRQSVGSRRRKPNFPERGRELRPRRRTGTALFPNATARRLSSIGRATQASVCPVSSGR
jgi:multidrug resistance efflux pump